MQETGAQLIAAVSEADNLESVLTANITTLNALIESHGLALVLDGKCVLAGRTPTETEVLALADWLKSNAEEPVEGYNALPRAYDNAVAFKDEASGLLALTISRARRNYLLWFRPESLELVNWGGNPEKPVETTEDGLRMSPRRSFALWQQRLQLTSAPWRRSEIAVALELRKAIIALERRKAAELSRLNADLLQGRVKLDVLDPDAVSKLQSPCVICMT